MFLIFLPRNFIETVVVTLTSSKLSQPLSFGEFLCFLGLWLVITRASPGNLNRRDFWSKYPVNREKGAPFRLNDLMSSNRFEEIIQALSYTSNDPPSYVDRIWEVREMIKAWNDNMAAVFTCGWITCLDESMSIWNNKWTCPGWIFCPRKPHPIGNEYHSICCGLSSIMFAIELVEGRARPKELPSDPKTKKTTCLLLRLCKSMYSAGKVVILDSGFCVLEGLVELKKVGVFVFAGALIKKRRYWPKHVQGDMIDSHFKDAAVGHVDAWSGILNDVPYDIWCMKEPDYIMKIMGTYGELTVPEGQRVSVRRIEKVDGTSENIKFQYNVPFAYHFDKRYIVDDHNGLRHMYPSLEQIWVTERWATRVFTFLIALCEVNTYLAFRYYIWTQDKKLGMMEFRSKLGWALIHNEYLKKTNTTRGSKRKIGKVKAHLLVSAPPHARKFIGGKWDCTAKCRYQQYICSGEGCKKATRPYCVCSVGQWICTNCLPDHVINAEE